MTRSLLVSRSLFALLAVLTITALLTPAAGAKQKSSPVPKCGTKSGSTMLSTGSLRVYLRNVTLDHGSGPVTSAQAYACSPKYPRSVPLQLCGFGAECFTFSGLHHWTGRFLIYGHQFVAGASTDGEAVYVTDLKTGRNNLDAIIPRPGISDDPRCGGYACTPSFRKLVGARGTSYALSYRVSTLSYFPPLPSEYHVIETHCVASDIVTDHAVAVGHPATEKEAESLKIKGRTIHWLENGKKRSAPLCPND